jgi:hypothetical protein
MRSQETAPTSVSSPSEPDEACKGHDKERNWKYRTYYQWIGLRENLQETIDFPIKYGAFL